MEEFEKAQTESAKKIFDLKVKIKYVETQWANSTIKI